MKPRYAAVLALLGWYLALSSVPGSRAAAQSVCDSGPASENPCCSASIRVQQVRDRNMKKLLAIPGVDSVGCGIPVSKTKSPSAARAAIAACNFWIQLWVWDPKKLAAVKRAAPKSVEGVPVEVSLPLEGTDLPLPDGHMQQ
ncbi:MAG: hypothetical protein WCA22_06310 [Candidatus Binatus sp.]